MQDYEDDLSPLLPPAIEANFYDDVLTQAELNADAERRRALEASGRIAAEVYVDLTENGPLGCYVAARRADAIAALQVLAIADVRDAVAMAQAQAEVAEYLRARQWIVGIMQDAANARRTIQEEYGTPDDDQVDGYSGQSRQGRRRRQRR